jgi:phosphohistidine phosphatase
MKTLTLIRHAKSSWNEPSVRDFDRTLNERGTRDAPVMGRRLAERDPGIDLIVTSPAKRARKTAGIIASAIGYPEQSIHLEPGIYEASAAELLEIVRHLPEEKMHVAMVGHNPGMTDIANLFSESAVPSLPTCGIVYLGMSVPRWGDAGPATGILVDFDTPKSGPR